MTRAAVVCVAGVLCAVLTLRAGPAGRPIPSGIRPAPAVASAAPLRPSPNDTIRDYCSGCHNQYDFKGELSLDDFDVAHADQHAATAEKMIRKLRAGLMPPKGEKQPDHDTRLALVTALETTLDAAAAKPNPGHRTFQRLNRAEYAAAVKAMFGIDVDVTEYLPSDTISASFDNIADVQMPSATVMQGYLRAAAYVASAVAGDPNADAASTTYEVPRTQSQKERVEGAPFGTRGGIVVTHNFLADGDYRFQLLLHGEPTGALFGRTIGKIQMEVAIDGERAALVQVDRWMSESDPDGLTVSTPPVAVRAGPHKVAATFIREFEGEEDDLMKPIDHTLADTQIGVGYGVTTLPHLRNLAIVGPFKVTGVSDNPARQRVFTCHPAKTEDGTACAKQILERLTTVAYRRPSTPGDVAELMPFYQQGAKAGGFDAGIRTSLQAMLSSLHFIFRVEEMPPGVRGGAVYKLADADLASRLSFFLWGTIPDQELIDLARKGTLSKPDVFEREIGRMLEDPRADALGTRFAAQWLRLQDLKKVEPDALLFPYYDATLADAMMRETELFFDHLVRADRPALELLTADYTFVNERLARHYGIRGVTGPDFVKVTYPDDTRRGILGHGSILTLTSHGNRTSPVLRGKWVLEVLLGTPPPPPPPNVPDLEKTGDTANGRLLSVAEQLAQHRKSPFCSSCHNVIDPIGLSLDHFDVTGGWRIKDRGVPVNTDGQLYDGTPLHGAADLRAALVARSDVVVTHLTEMLMAYAIGRRVEYYDMPTIRKIVREAAPREYRMSALILGVVNSPAFRSAVAEGTSQEGR
ncbi:MAG TPA: DUF1592 domain-containing protein [Vicinamibacterales bacterium]|nr:DUF1592 domain-containing protein [Vicinamibacterales bacterium]